MKNLQFSLPVFNKKKKEKTRIGLDWGFSSLKVVVLESRDDKHILKEAKIIQLPSKELNLNSLLKDLDLSVGVNLGVCGPNVMIRYTSMARMNEAEFKNSLRYEAASHFPFSIDKLNIDGVILKDMPDNQMLVMLAAAKKDFIQQRLKLFQEAKIKVNILDIDSLALINAFNYTHPHTKENNILSGAITLLNIGASVTNTNVLEDGIPHFSRDINIAGNDFARESSRTISITNFVSEIRKSFDYYESSSAAVINKIFLSGGGSLAAGLVEELEKNLGIQIEQWDPFSNFEFAVGLDEQDIRKNSARFAVAVGLALRQCQ